MEGSACFATLPDVIQWQLRARARQALSGCGDFGFWAILGRSIFAGVCTRTVASGRATQGENTPLLHTQSHHSRPSRRCRITDADEGWSEPPSPSQVVVLPVTAESAAGAAGRRHCLRADLHTRRGVTHRSRRAWGTARATERFGLSADTFGGWGTEHHQPRLGRTLPTLTGTWIHLVW